MSVANVENILKESRSAIIDLLKTQGALTVEQLAAGLDVSKVCIRRHLNLLERDGLIAYEQAQRERGRPYFVYRLTAKASCLFPCNYDEFAKEVLLHVKREFGEEALQRVLQGRADALLDELRDQLGHLNFDERVKAFVKIISEKGYLAETRKLKDGTYRLRQRHCPTEKVAADYPHICEQEIRVYEEALGCAVIRDCRIAEGATMCEFHLVPGNGRAPLPIYYGKQ